LVLRTEIAVVGRSRSSKRKFFGVLRSSDLHERVKAEEYEEEEEEEEDLLSCLRSFAVLMSISKYHSRPPSKK
jgi:hypothetical protein